MKSIYTCLLLCLFLFSCQSDDNDPEIACITITPVFSNLFIELVNTDGQNLIENETYIPDNITVDFDGDTFTNVVFTNVQGLENFVAVGVFGDDGDNTFEINLSDTETDILVLNLTRETVGDVCPQTIFELNSVTYNGESKELQDFGGDFLITVVKE